MEAAAARCWGPRAPGRACAHEVLGTDIGNMPVDDRDAVLTTFADFRPELVLHGGALTAVDRCETEADLAFAVNAVGTRHVAEAAALVGAHVVYVSTDYVFDGTSIAPTARGTPRARSPSTAPPSWRESRNAGPGRRLCARAGCAERTGPTWS